MATINPYLNFNGNAEEAFNFYKSVFGGEFRTLQKMKDIPEMPGFTVQESDKEKVMHVSFPIGKENVLMGTDILESMGQTLSVGNNFSISISADSQEEADKLFNSLAEGGNITMPLATAVWGAYFGMLVDKFGIKWMVNYDFNQSQ